MNLGSPWCGGSGRGRQVTRDLMDLRGCEANRFFLLAANRKNCEQQGNSHQRETRRTPYLDSKAMQDGLNRVTLLDHGKLKQPFSLGPSTNQALGERWGLPEKAGVVRARVPSAFQAAALPLLRLCPNHLQGRRAPLLLA